MKVFVTGASGFIGTRTKALLEERGHTVHALSARLEDSDAVERELDSFKPGAVLHIAWEGIPDLGEEMSAKNVRTSLGFLRAVATRKIGRVVAVGSSYQIPGVDPADHRSFIAAKGRIRDEGGEMIRSAGGIFIWTYPFFVYGPGKRSGSLIPSLISMAERGEAPAAKNPDAFHDFIYVNDVAEALVLLVETPVESGEYEIGSGELTRTGEIAKIVAKACGYPEQVLESISVQGVHANIDALRQDTNWKSKVSIEEGVARMLTRS